MTSSGDVVTDYTATGAGVPVHANSYAQGVGTDDKVARIPATGGTAARRYYVGDAVDTMTQTLDNATGTSTEQHVRDAWGNLVVETAASTERYAGLAQREVDGESGYTYVRNRMYDPKLGRFTQTDPILNNRPFKHYIYGSNYPLFNTDPWGLQDATGKPKKGPPVNRTDCQGSIYVCTCPQGWFGALIEPMVGPNWARNWNPVESPCLCGVPKSGRGDAARRLQLGVGMAIADSSLETMKVSNPGVAIAVLAEQWNSGSTVSVNPQSITKGEAVGEFALSVGANLGFQWLGGKLGALAGEMRANAMSDLNTLGRQIRAESLSELVGPSGSEVFFINLRTSSPGESIRVVTLSGARYPTETANLQSTDTINRIFTLDRAGAAQRRALSLRDVTRVPGFDRCEYPPAVFRQGSRAVFYGSPSENRGAGASMGNQLRGVPDGSKVIIIIDQARSP